MVVVVGGSVVVVVVGAVVVDVGSVVVVDLGGELRVVVVVVVGVTIVDVVGRDVVVVAAESAVVGPSTVGAVVGVVPAAVFAGAVGAESNRPTKGEFTDAAPVFSGGAPVVCFWEPDPAAVVGVFVAGAVLGATIDVEVDVAARCGDSVSLSMNPT